MKPFNDCQQLVECRRTVRRAVAPLRLQFVLRGSLPHEMKILATRREEAIRSISAVNRSESEIVSPTVNFDMAIAQRKPSTPIVAGCW